MKNVNTKKTSIAIPPESRSQIIALIIEGWRESDIRKQIKNDWPDVNADALLRLAVEHFANASRCELGIVIGWGLEAYRDTYRKALEAGDFASAVRAIKELTALAAKHCVYDQSSDQQNSKQTIDAEASE